MNKFDVIVLGISPDGLAVASLCAKNGQRVALMCHKDIAVQEFIESSGFIPYLWDSDIGAFSIILHKLGLKDDFKLTKPELIDTVDLDNIRINRKNDLNDYCLGILEKFPNEKQEIQLFFNELTEVGMEWLNLLKTGSIFSVKKIMAYRNVIYVDYLNQHFKNQDLINILSVDMPRTNITFPVMAGYIVTQVFDKHILELSYPDMLSVFSEFLRSKNGEVLLQDKIVKISLLGKGQEPCFEVRTSQNTFLTKWIVSTYDENLTYESYFPDLPVQKTKIDRLTPVSQTSVKLTKPVRLGNDISLKYFSGKSPGNVLHNIEHGNNAAYKISTYSIGQELFVQGEFFPGTPGLFRKSKIMEYLHSLIPDLEIEPKELQWFYPEDIEKTFGYSYGFPHRWAFRADETPVNPFNRVTAVDNLLCTGSWGAAWFTAAISTSRFIRETKIL
jgi:hypothetical protein